MDEFVNKIIEAKERVAKLDLPDKHIRLRHLDEIRADYVSANLLKKPKIFVSYNTGEGLNLVKEAETYFRRLPVFRDDPDGLKFDVLHGMKDEDRQGKGEHNVQKFINQLVSQSCFFVGILTEEYAIDKSDMKVPGPWPIYEAGMGFVHNLKIIMMVEESIDGTYWKKLFSVDRQIKFNRRNFKSKLKTCGNRIQAEYQKLIEEESENGRRRK